jgi:o-succinylbenzoate synthase
VPLLAGIRGHRMAKAALEAAVLDAQLRACGMPLAEYLGGVRDHVRAGVSLGITGSVEELVDLVAANLEQGYPRIKLKIEPGWDLAPVAAVRSRFGEDLELQVDANCAYTRGDLAHLTRLDEYRLALIEQPFAADDLAAHADLAARSTTPVCLDESIHSAGDAVRALSVGAASVLNIKAGRVGGYLEARRIHDLCRANGVPVWCGGMLETGIGRAANLALAACPNFTLPGDISATGRYFAEDITAPFELDDGQLPVPAGPGSGVEILPDVLARLTIEQELLR